MLQFCLSLQEVRLQGYQYDWARIITLGGVNMPAPVMALVWMQRQKAESVPLRTMVVGRLRSDAIRPKVKPAWIRVEAVSSLPFLRFIQGVCNVILDNHIIGRGSALLLAPLTRERTPHEQGPGLPIPI